MRIVVTNDDGIDSLGLHALARAMRRHGEVTIVAPDQEYSGAGAAFGALHLLQPVVHEVDVEGIDTAYSVNGPPGLCIMFVRMGAFGPPPDLVVSGINPGANVGRAVYHSGTVGAGITARNGGIPSVAVSQAVDGYGVEGQSWEDVVANQKWDAAAQVADIVVEALIADMPDDDAPVLNVNVPDRDFDDIAGWKLTDVGTIPPRALATASLEPRPGHLGSYTVTMDWGEATDVDPETDVGAVMNGYVSLSWLSRITNRPPDAEAVGNALTNALR